MSAENRDTVTRLGDGIRLNGLMHRIEVTSTGSAYDPVQVAITRHGECMIALLSPEHIDALHEFLGQHVTRPSQR